MLPRAVILEADAFELELARDGLLFSLSVLSLVRADFRLVSGNEQDGRRLRFDD